MDSRRTAETIFEGLSYTRNGEYLKAIDLYTQAIEEVPWPRFGHALEQG